jgi:hypothetical protein
MTVSMSGSGFVRGSFFSGFFSGLTGGFGSETSSAASLLAILRDDRAGARLLPRVSFRVEADEMFEETCVSVIAQVDASVLRGDTTQGGLEPCFCRILVVVAILPENNVE